MSERQTNSATGRIGIIDLGSNSLRLAVFERHGGALFPLINEKVMCGLARGLSTSGRLNPDGVALALVNLQALCRPRAGDRGRSPGGAGDRRGARRQRRPSLCRRGRARVRRAGRDNRRRRRGTVVRRGRARRHPRGGGDRRRSRRGQRRAGSGRDRGIATEAGGRIGRGITLPLGPLRLAELGDNAKAVSEAVERALAAAPVARAGIGQNLYLVGGASRAHRPAAHGAYALPASHRPPLHDRPRRGGGLFRDRRSAVAQIARTDHHHLAQASRNGAAGGTDAAQTGRRRRPATRHLFCLRAARRLRLRSHSSR